jgi:hypothetical protein
VKATDAVTAGAVLQALKAKADKRSKITGTTVTPVFVKRIEAQEEADRLNVINQSVIGAKEGVTEGVTIKVVDSNITDTILRTPDGSDHKSVDHPQAHHQNIRKEFLTPHIVIEMLQIEQSYSD